MGRRGERDAIAPKKKKKRGLHIFFPRFITIVINEEKKVGYSLYDMSERLGKNRVICMDHPVQRKKKKTRIDRFFSPYHDFFLMFLAKILDGYVLSRGQESKRKNLYNRF